jgi:hypothetical protein
MNEIKNVIQRRSEFVDVFTVKWSNEGLIQPREDLVGHFVATMFKGLQLLDTRLHVLHVVKDSLQEACAIGEIIGHVGEHLEELR